MRRLQPKIKDRRKVTIPDELRQSLREVHQLIREAKHDPEVVLDYDDAIQVGQVCGGKVGSKQRPFVLTYYQDDDRERGKWYLTLHRTEVEDLGDGVLSELMMYCCTSADCRCKFREVEQHCSYCDYADE